METDPGITKLLKKIESRMRFLCYWPVDTFNLKGYCIFSFSIYFLAQTIFLMIMNWEEWSFGFKVLSVENLNYLNGVLSLSTDAFVNTKRTRFLFEIMSSKNRYYTYEVSLIARHNTRSKALHEKFQTIRNNIVKNMEARGIFYVSFSKNILDGYYASQILSPIFGVTSYFLGYATIDQLSLPFIFYFPNVTSSKYPNIRSISNFILICIVEFFQLAYASWMTFMLFSSLVISVNNIVVELQLFRVYIDEFNAFYGRSKVKAYFSGEYPFQSQTDSNLGFHQRNSDSDLYCKSLRHCMRNLAVHHQTIHRKIRMLNEMFSYSMFYANTFICFQLCFAIFCFQIGDFFFKIKYGLLLVSMLMLQYAYSENGQMVKDEVDKMRLALNECDWEGQPSWFHSYFQMMLIRSSVEPQLNVFNIFTMDRKNMASVVQAAYSYFNLLSRLMKN